LQDRAKILLRQLDDDKATIIVPTVVVAELLVPLRPAQHGEFIAELRRRFFCPPLELQAAALAAELWRKHRGLPKSQQAKRTTLKADVLIIATARVAGASIFYSHEPKCRRLAKLAKMEARDLPMHHENMFVDREIRGAGGRPEKR
jgi:predicted nucleic acid-binding protein